MVRRRYDDRGIAASPAAAFEQQRNVEYDNAGMPVGGKELPLRAADERVNDLFQLAQPFWIAEHSGAKPRPVKTVRTRRSGKGLLDRGQCRAARLLQPVHLRIGIKHMNAGFAEHRRDGRLSHADRTGEAEHDHCASSARSSSSCSRGGAAPKNISNASAAWPISISSPSTVSRPRARAAASSGVTNGA